MKLIHFFLVKKDYYVKSKIFSHKIFFNCAFMVQIRIRNRNRNLSKVGTGTCLKSELEPKKNFRFRNTDFKYLVPCCFNIYNMSRRLRTY
jgi:hypothetical protein